MKQPWHLTLELIDADPVLLADLERTYSFLLEGPKQIDMTRISIPYVFPYTAEDPLESGVTGFVVLAESHISIHSYQNKGTSYLDCFSCRVFEPENFIKLAKETFGSLRYKFCLIDRNSQTIIDKGEVMCYNEETGNMRGFIRHTC